MSVPGTNFGKAAADYGGCRAGFPDSFFDRLATHDVGVPGQTVIDLGTGTGTLARGFALRDCSVTGVDVDARMLETATELDKRSGVKVRYVIAAAESTGLDTSSADVVVAGQCWHWFDRAQAAAEVARLLRADGKLVIGHFDWLPLAGNVVDATEKLIMHHNPNWHMDAGVGIHSRWLPGLTEAGFRNLESFSYDVDVSYSAEAWRRRIQASAGVAALDSDAASRFDDALRELLETRFPSSVLAVPHRVFAIVAEAPIEEDVALD